MSKLFSRYESGNQFTAGAMVGSILGVSGINPLIDRLNSITSDDGAYSNLIAGEGIDINNGSEIKCEDATTTNKGIIEIATEDEVQTGTDTSRAIVPDTLQVVLPPVGAIIAWLKSFTSVPQTLPTGWKECDGSEIIDADSPMIGEHLPDLNGGEFLRGSSTTGGTGGSDTMAHTHTGTASGNTGNESSHTHTFSDTSSAPSASGANMGSGDYNVPTTYHTHDVSGTTGAGSSHHHSFSDSFTTSAASNTENRPKYYNVIWIMRIK